jgi:hypothetical protein
VRKVKDTKGVTILASLLDNLETFFQRGLLSWLLFVAAQAYHHFLWMFMSDSAKSNIMAVKILCILLLSAECGSLLVLFWWERCGGHQLGRIVTVVLSKYDLAASLYALSKLLDQIRARNAFRDSCHKVLDEAPRLYQPHTNPPLVEPATKRFRKRVKDMLRSTFGDTPYWVVSDGSDELDNLLEFFNSDITSNEVVHHCKGIECCKDKTDCHKRAKLFLDRATFLKARMRFEPAKFTKQLHAIGWVLVFCILHNLGKVAIDLVPNPALLLAALGRNNPVLELIGARWRRAKQLYTGELTTFHLLLVMILLGVLDQAMKALFHMQKEGNAAGAMGPGSKKYAKAKNKGIRKNMGAAHAQGAEEPSFAEQNAATADDWRPDVLKGMAEIPK